MPIEREGAGPEARCHLLIKGPHMCEDGYLWLQFTCIKHGTTWRESCGVGTAMLSCTTRVSALTREAYQASPEDPRWHLEDDDDSEVDDGLG